MLEHETYISYTIVLSPLVQCDQLCSTHIVIAEQADLHSMCCSACLLVSCRTLITTLQGKRWGGMERITWDWSNIQAGGRGAGLPIQREAAYVDRRSGTETT
jgi:hypothetical protein